VICSSCGERDGSCQCGDYQWFDECGYCDGFGDLNDMSHMDKD
jgi:hypothetical protein